MKILDDPDRLLRDAQAGRSDCAAIYRLVRKPMYVAVWRCLRPCQSYGGLTDDDVVARAFDELMNGGLHGATSLLGKARVIAYRRAVDVVRRRNPEECRDCLEDIEDDEELADELERRECLSNRAAVLLDRLPAGQRLAIVETVMKRRTCSDVAAQLDVSHQAVSKARKKGLERLLVWLFEEDALDGRPPEEESG
jgi:RNA polymerase sigma factor (sigma-70 family)